MVDYHALPVLVVAPTENDAEQLNGILRGAGYAVRARWAASADHAASALKDEPPELILCFAGMDKAPIADIASLRGRICGPAPIIAISAQDKSFSISEVMQAGACDLISVNEIERLRWATARELENLGMRRQLETYRNSNQHYAARIEALMRESGDAIAYAQEGICVNANPAYLRLFDFERPEDIEGLPVMDLFDPRDQGAVRSAIRAAGQDEQSVQAITVQIRTTTGKTIPIAVTFAAHEMDGSPGVEIAIRNTTGHHAKDPARASQPVGAHRDPNSLNDLQRRQTFIAQLSATLQQPTGGATALFCIRLDNLSRISARVGLIKSEMVLAELADLVRQALGVDDAAGCFAGCIFMALTRFPVPENLLAWGEKLRRDIASHVFEPGGQSITLTCSLGYTVLGNDIETIDQALARSCEACEDARQAGGNRIVGYRPVELPELVSDRSDAMWTERITAALKNGDFLLVYQPVTSLKGHDGELFDVLVRMLDENRNVIPASDFIPAAERTGLVLGIERWILEQALRQLAERENTDQTRLLVRTSAQSLKDETSLAWIGKLLASFTGEAVGSQLIFQIPEALAETHLKHVKAFSAGVRKLGCGFAIEHLGSGHSSIQLLEHVKLDYGKIDGSVITAPTLNDRQRGRLQTLIDKAKSLNIPIIAEHVETADTMAALWHMGVSYIQGNYVQEPEVIMADTRSSFD